MKVISHHGLNWNKAGYVKNQQGLNIASGAVQLKFKDSCKGDKPLEFISCFAYILVFLCVWIVLHLKYNSSGGYYESIDFPLEMDMIYSDFTGIILITDLKIFYGLCLLVV